jgi:hypothetical protein
MFELRDNGERSMEVFYCVTVVGIVAIVALVLRFRFTAQVSDKEVGFTADPPDSQPDEVAKGTRRKRPAHK